MDFQTLWDIFLSGVAVAALAVIFHDFFLPKK
jgi:hypothetical protein